MTAALTLYHTPGTCSRVVLNALEELELDYDDEPINIFRGEQRGAAYLALNAKGKVPALLVGGTMLTESAAIVNWLDGGHGLLLPAADDAARAIVLGDLIWCADTLHALVRMARMPERVSPGDPDSVRHTAAAKLADALEQIGRRLADRQWWLGPHWSIVDVYLAWIFGMSVAVTDLGSVIATLSEHSARVTQRPSYQRAHAREQSALKRAGIILPDGAKL